MTAYMPLVGDQTAAISRTFVPLAGGQTAADRENKCPPKRRAFMLYVLQSDCVVKAQKRYTAEGLADGSGSPDDRRATSEQRHISCVKILCPQPQNV